MLFINGVLKVGLFFSFLLAFKGSVTKLMLFLSPYLINSTHLRCA